MAPLSLFSFSLVSRYDARGSQPRCTVRYIIPTPPADVRGDRTHPVDATPSSLVSCCTRRLACPFPLPLSILPSLYAPHPPYVALPLPVCLHPAPAFFFFLQNAQRPWSAGASRGCPVGISYLSRSPTRLFPARIRSSNSLILDPASCILKLHSTYIHTFAVTTMTSDDSPTSVYDVSLTYRATPTPVRARHLKDSNGPFPHQRIRHT